MLVDEEPKTQGSDLHRFILEGKGGDQLFSLIRLGRRWLFPVSKPMCLFSPLHSLVTALPHRNPTRTVLGNYMSNTDQEFFLSFCLLSSWSLFSTFETVSSFPSPKVKVAVFWLTLRSGRDKFLGKTMCFLLLCCYPWTWNTFILVGYSWNKTFRWKQ